MSDLEIYHAKIIVYPALILLFWLEFLNIFNFWYGMSCKIG